MQLHKPVTIIIFLIVIVILTFLFALPKYQEYQDLKIIMAQSQVKYSNQSIYYAKVSDVLSGLQTRKEVLDKITGSLPDEFSLGPVMAFLQQKGTENNVKITSVVFAQNLLLPLDQVSYQTAPSQVKEVAFTLSATGSYQGLKSFLFSLDNSARLFEMNSVSFTQVDAINLAKSKTQEYMLKLEVKTHSY